MVWDDRMTVPSGTFRSDQPVSRVEIDWSASIFGYHCPNRVDRRDTEEDCPFSFSIPSRTTGLRHEVKKERAGTGPPTRVGDGWCMSATLTLRLAMPSKSTSPSSSDPGPGADARRKAEKRQRIFKASLHLFARHGYEATTIRMIAREANISLGLLYNYFNGKDAVLREIYEKSVIDMMRAFMVHEESSHPEEKFERLIHQIFRSVRKNLLFYKLFYSIRTQPSVQKLLAPRFAGLNRYIHANLESLLVELGYRDYETEARLLYALIDGTSMHYLLAPRQYPLEAVEKAILRRYCGNGVRV